MTLHKLSAGDGYTYLTRQVAAHDATERTQAGLAEYYSERGEAPGRWAGSGATALGLSDGDEVSEAQMVALFGHGHHPLEPDRPLGREFTTPQVSSLRSTTAKAFSAHNREQGLPAHTAIPAEDRARIRTTVTVDAFTAQYGRAPSGTRELAGYLARKSTPESTPVAGYDLTFTPVKSVSALWALAPKEVAAQVLAAHDAAVADVISWLEREVAFTRTGHAGIRQVPVTGLVATAFQHRDSRDGDPNLHTHVAISNKVQARLEYGGGWLALDGRMLFKAKVAASERYNTRLEAELVERLGVRFVNRRLSPGKRPVREIEGVDPSLVVEWSKRRQAITLRQGRLASDFLVHHGRPPTTIEERALAQQANLETRRAKHEPRSEVEQRAAWRRDAQRCGFDPDGLVAAALNRGRDSLGVGGGDLPSVAAATVATLEACRATWQVWHVRAEVERQIRAARIPRVELDNAVDRVVTHVLHDLSVRLDTPDGVHEPAALTRPDGTSQYDVDGRTRYTSERVLDAEQTVLSASRRTDGCRVELIRLGLTLAEAADRRPLDASQTALVTALATSGARVQVALAPAGTGKTTIMRVLADAWREAGGNVLGLAPSAVAARELGTALLSHADTLAKFTSDLTTRRDPALPEWQTPVGPKTLIVVDEAGMACTADLATLVTFALDRGASVRLVGDDQQLASVAAGGILRDLAHEAPSASLSVVHRLTDSSEAAASLAIRDGDASGLGFYTDHGRIHLGTPETAGEAAYQAWATDKAAGLDSLLLAPTREVATTLNGRARSDRLGGATPRREVTLRDGTCASAGDVVLTRQNHRRLVTSDTDWVKNGDRWRIRAIDRNGSIKVARIARPGVSVLLPAEYVTEHVQLGYAVTIHSAQGMTVDSCHTVLAGTEDRQLLYGALTRGRAMNHVYLAPPTDAEPDLLPHSEPLHGLQGLQAILARDGSQESATTIRRVLADPATQLHEAVLRFQDAVERAMHSRPGEGTLDQLERGGPLPWLPHIPSELAIDPTWGTYLQERAQQIADLASRIGDPLMASWSQEVEPCLRKDIAVWRAAYAIPDTEMEPTGPRVDGPGRQYQRALDRQICMSVGRATCSDDWLEELPEEVTQDPVAPNLQRRLRGLASEGAVVSELIPAALRIERPLPAENPADALWWRVLSADASTPRHKATREPAPRTMQQPSTRQVRVHSRPARRPPELGR